MPLFTSRTLYRPDTRHFLCIPYPNFYMDPCAFVIMVLLVVLLFAGSMISFFILNYPEINETRTYIPTTCNFTHSEVVEKYETGLAPQGCTTYRGESCYDVAAGIRKLSPAACHNGTGPCPPAQTICDNGYYCCAQMCTPCSTGAHGGEKREVTEPPYEFDMGTEEGVRGFEWFNSTFPDLVAASPNATVRTKETKDLQKRCGCTCISWTFDQAAYVEPYLTYYPTFYGNALEHMTTGSANNNNGQGVWSNIQIQEYFGTDSQGAKDRLTQVPLHTRVQCYYNPANPVQGSLSIAQTPWKWIVTGLLLGFLNISFTAFCCLGWAKDAKGALCIFIGIWCVYIPCFYIFPAIASKLITTAGIISITIVCCVCVGFGLLFVSVLGEHRLHMWSSLGRRCGAPFEVVGRWFVTVTRKKNSGTNVGDGQQMPEMPPPEYSNPTIIPTIIGEEEPGPSSYLPPPPGYYAGDEKA